MRPVALIALLTLALLAGCAAPPPQPDAAELRLQPAQYGPAFTAAKKVLRDARFELDRVDGRAGVIASHPKPSAGLATPWDQEQTTAGQEVDDFLNFQQRRIRVTFEPATPPPDAAAGGDPTDLAELAAAGVPMVMRIRVIVERIERPGWRPDPAGVIMETRTSDPELARRGLEPGYPTAIGEDRWLAARLTGWIRDEVQRAPSEPAAPQAPAPATPETTPTPPTGG